jgi:hypothetical protein
VRQVFQSLWRYRVDIGSDGLLAFRARKRLIAQPRRFARDTGLRFL